jgi:hypothetical protein
MCAPLVQPTIYNATNSRKLSSITMYVINMDIILYKSIKWTIPYICDQIISYSEDEKEFSHPIHCVDISFCINIFNIFLILNMMGHGANG